ncbi:SDR family oxidoreductase [Halorubrum vacuolatum]|uniref:3-oxoacyl-[acyl-carrier protein] reductase n=1 Tax=Halorubrum vacuolatum TaxID=63740 RepID=A0A238WIY6_HALVU|nr:SDR family oxidoreductase [Halorubrum vacuolatum]SNR46194.1 3-oxoacyl-[acyl-carrier protein] reductase [Halorubrum vacuolatum]
MDLQLKDSAVFVSAASKGLGFGTALEFAREGANVTIASRSAENLAAARERITEETGRDDAVHAVEVDLEDRDSIESGIAEAIETFGGLDVLVTNHGGPENATFEETTLDELDGGYNDVLRSTAIQCKAALPALREGGGAITHLVAASAAEPKSPGTLGNVFRPGIYGLSKTLANEEGERGVRSNCVAPRGVLSDRIEEKIQARAEREGISEQRVRELRVEELPLPQMGTLDEFGKAVAFVSSPAASYITGAVIPLDGGWTRRIM